MQARDREIRPAQMDAHEPGQKHSHEHGDQGQSVILLANYFVIQTENMFSDETRGRLMSCMCRVVHFP
jgi:hypothetical protein